jgi:hypothetical protein
VAVLPFLTLPDPTTTGEGALDPLGLSTIGDRLAERILPGLRARMSRPRFITAMAVCASVCEGLEDQIAKDGVTSPYLVFEWLLVEAFVRCADRESFRNTPGTLKAQAVKESNEVMCARTYLRVPNVFGFNGVYKVLARNLCVVRDDLQLGETGYDLLKVWQEEQGLAGFLESSVTTGGGTTMRGLLRAAVQDGLRDGYSARSPAWQGWRLLAEHLLPSKIGRRESEFLRQALVNEEFEPRGEVFHLLKPVRGDVSEAHIIKNVMRPKASRELAKRLDAVASFEAVGSLLDDSLDWIRHLSSIAGARAITAADFAKNSHVRRISSALPKTIAKAEKALEAEPLPIQKMFGDLARSFDRTKKPEDLFEAVLAHHSAVQKAKPPDGKRDWFERATGGATFVRVPYQLKDPVEHVEAWRRPYRITAARSFLADFSVVS